MSWNSAAELSTYNVLEVIPHNLRETASQDLGDIAFQLMLLTAMGDIHGMTSSAIRQLTRSAKYAWSATQLVEAKVGYDVLPFLMG